ncbi:TolC Outer membrane protein [Rhabdaerophilaceae bacterium]
MKRPSVFRLAFGLAAFLPAMGTALAEAPAGTPLSFELRLRFAEPEPMELPDRNGSAPSAAPASRALWFVRPPTSRPSFEATASDLSATAGSELSRMGGLLREVLDRSDRLRAARADERAMQARVWKAWAGFAPVVTANAWMGSDPTAAPRLDDPGKTLTFSGTLPIFDGGQAMNSVRAAQSMLAAARADTRATREQLGVDVMGSILELTMARRQVAMLSDNVMLLEKLSSAVVARKAGGLASQTDLDQVQADLAEARAIRLSAEATEVRARARISSLLRRPFNDNLVLPRLDQIAHQSLDELVLSAERNNAGVESAWHRFRASDHTSNVVKARYLPRLDARADYKIVQNYKGNSANEGWTVGLSLRVPLVDVGTMADIFEAKENASAALYRAQDKRHEVTGQVTIEWEQQKALQRRSAQSRRQVAALSAVVNSRVAQFRAGVIPLEDVLTASRRLTSARTEEQEILAQRQASLLRIATLAGLTSSIILPL